MSTSLQVVAPKGYMQMRQGWTYVVLRNCRITQRVLLVAFEDIDRERKNKSRTRKAHLIAMPRDHYEDGLAPPMAAPPAILPAPRAMTLPPWLHDLEGEVFEASERWLLRATGARTRRLSPQEEAERRQQFLTPALERIDKILLSDRPDYELNCIARACVPPVNETRFRTWFYAYVAFGFRVWALLSPRTEWGKWDRLDDDHCKRSYGRTSTHLEGMFLGPTDGEMVRLMVDGFREYAKECDTLTDTWAMTVRLKFGGQVIQKPGERPVAYHPEKKALPGYDKFYYRIHKEVGSEEIAKVLKGAQRVEFEDTPIRGSVFADLANIGERANYDSTHVKEHPKRYVGAGHLPPLQTVYLSDGSDRQTKGVGFSLGGEDSTGYLMALFVAANKKSVIGRIFGVRIDDADWPGQGLPVHLVSDRGPAFTEPVRSKVSQWLIAVSAGRSYYSRDNAASEGKHPRRARKGGAPQHKLSDHTVIELIRRELHRAILKNKTDSVARVAEDRAVVEGNAVTPNDLYLYLLKRHRTSLIQISFEESVRAFLPKVKFQVVKGLLYLKGREYSSSQLFSSGLAKQMHRASLKEVSGYVVPFVTKFAWLEFGGQLIEVESKEHGDPALASLDELELIEAERKEATAGRRAKNRVKVLAAQSKFHEETGKEWHSNKTKSGQYKKTKSGQDEVRRLKALA